MILYYHGNFSITDYNRIQDFGQMYELFFISTKSNFQILEFNITTYTLNNISKFWYLFFWVTSQHHLFCIHTPLSDANPNSSDASPLITNLACDSTAAIDVTLRIVLAKRF